MIYFDNAATSYPKPTTVLEAVQSAFSDFGANPGRSGHKMSVDTAAKVFECRLALAEMFGAQSGDNVVFTQNCTQAINICLKGLLKAGDHVIISDLEHNSVARPVAAMAQEMGVQYSICRISQDDEETAMELKKLICPRTKLIAVTHCSNAFGIITPVNKIAEIAHENGILLMIDAAQSAGVLPINISEMGIDFLCMPGHKGLYGPSGTGALITALGEQLSTIMEGGTGSNSLKLQQPVFMPDRLECGTVNTVGILGLHAGVRAVQEIGIENIYAHEFALLKKAYDGLAEIPNVKLYTQPPIYGRQAPVLSFTVDGHMAEETCKELDLCGFALRGGYHCAPLAHKKMNTLDTGTARMSLGIFNTDEEIDLFMSAMKVISEKSHR